MNTYSSRLLSFLFCLICILLVTPSGRLTATGMNDILLFGRHSSESTALAEIEEEHRLSMDFITPHTDWAQPYAGGQTRMLFFSETSRWNTLPREAVELMQRFDITADAVFGNFVKSGQDPSMLWIGGRAGEERMLRLLQKPYDVFVLLHISPHNLPQPARDKFTEAIAEGTGLVMVGTDDRPQSRIYVEAPDDPEATSRASGYGSMLDSAERLRAKPDFLTGGSVTTTYTINKGRIAILPPRPNIEYHENWEIEYDYWQEQFGRVVLWAAQKEPKSTLHITPSAPEIAWTDVPGVTASVDWKDEPEGCELTASVRLQNGRRITLVTKKNAGPAGAESVKLPQLPAGSHHLEAMLRSAKGIENWAVIPLQVTSTRIVQVTLNPDWSEIGGTLSGKAALTGESLPHERVLIQLLDRCGRILAQCEIPPTDKTGAFSFPVSAWLPMLVTVKAIILSGGQEATSAYQYFHVTKRHQDQFNFVMWDCPTGTLGAYAQDALARLGTTVVLSSGNPRPEQAAYEQAWVPYTTRIRNLLTLDHISEGGCWNDLTVKQKLFDELAATAVPARRHGVFVYSLGDEGDVAGSCLHPACLAAYRKFLQQSYGTIGALNASWGSKYATFDEVNLSTTRDPEEDIDVDLKDEPEKPHEIPLYDNNEAVALKTKNFPRWYDRVAFQRWNLVQYCVRHAEAFRKIDPQARTGFEGSSGPPLGLGADVENLVNRLEFWGPYPSYCDELIRSISPRKLVRSNWMGYAKNANGLLYDYWRTITRGSDSVFFWMCQGVGNYHGLLSPDLVPYNTSKELTADTQIVRDGLGDLLLRCRRLDDGVAMLYSMPSECASGLEEGASFSIPRALFGGYTAEHMAWHQAIRDAGLQYTYVTERMLKAAPLDPTRYKVLIMPQTEAISTDSAKAIRAYVAAGGTVIADVRPGIYTDHCKPLTTGSLDDLFGIKRGTAGKAIPGDVKINGMVNKESLALSWSVEEACALGGEGYGADADPAVSLAGGTALGTCGQIPVGIVRQTGKGRAILMNFTLSTCFPPRNGRVLQTPEPVAAFVQHLLASAGVRPALTLQANGRQVRNVEVIRWQNGSSTILTFLRQIGEKEQVKLVLPPKAGYLYDLRSGKSLGPVTGTSVDLVLNKPAWYALLASPGPAITLLPAKPRATPGTPLLVKVSLPGTTAPQAIKLKLLGPDGKEADWARQIVIVGAQPVVVPIAMAYNDPAGNWTLEASDLLGQKTRLKFQL